MHTQPLQSSVGLLKNTDRLSRFLGITDEVVRQLDSLKMVHAFLSEVLENCHEEGIEMVGNWSVNYLGAAVGTIANFIERVDKITD